ncbi:permuted papain-like amidase YaeF/Yiix C92 family enzyme [Planomicrobium soli]|uniref:Permuted papain-like amidase YaeF/Yiix C92 family enzyme n=2 Tax=Planomicrobium soli TaxID=1176648 RepID=A0A2P8H3L1_9BACL|nr:permuted papain-like amidase YaeF/Yiix C92 family enzyme [Planomicrobium soli]
MLEQFDFIFYKGETPIARIIQRLTNSQYSHVAMVIDPLHLIQLDWKTPVSIQHLAYPISQYDVYRLKVALTEKEKAKVIFFIREWISTGYDWKLIISRFFNILLATPIVSSADRYNCDELIVDAFRHVGINLIEYDIQLTPDALSKSKLLYNVNENEKRLLVRKKK